MLSLASNSTFFSCNPRDFLLVYVNEHKQAVTLQQNSSYFCFRVFQWKPSLNSFDNHLHDSTFPMFLRILEPLPRSYFIQSFSRIVHHTLEKSTSKDKCTANPNHVGHNSRKKAFPFTHFLAPVCFYIFSFFSLY